MMTKFVNKHRLTHGLTIKELSECMNVDPSLVSKWENGSRMPTMSQLERLSEVLHLPLSEAKKHWYADKVIAILYDDIEIASDVLLAAEPRIEYLASKKVLKAPKVSQEIRDRLRTIDGLRDRWQSLHPLDQTQLSKMESYFRTLYTQQSNQIEGNTLTFQETELVVNQGITIAGKSMQEHLEAINHAEAAEFIMSLVRGDEDISKRILMELHGLILRGIDKDNAGRFRSVPVMISGSKHEPPQPFMIEPLMEDYLRNYRRQRDKLHAVILAAEMHERLVSIHPFIDGNGRTSRLVMNLILLHHGYTITSLKGDVDSRLRYYKALEEVQMDNNPEPFYELIIERCEASLREHIRLAGG